MFSIFISSLFFHYSALPKIIFKWIRTITHIVVAVFALNLKTFSLDGLLSWPREGFFSVAVSLFRTFSPLSIVFLPNWGVCVCAFLLLVKEEKEGQGVKFLLRTLGTFTQSKPKERGPSSHRVGT